MTSLSLNLVLYVGDKLMIGFALHMRESVEHEML